MNKPKNEAAISIVAKIQQKVHEELRLLEKELKESDRLVCNYTERRTLIDTKLNLLDEVTKELKRENE